MPRSVDHDQRRRDLALAACAVIARRGLAGATVRDVAREAGCTTGMVSHYFADKDQLLVAALDVATRNAGARIRDRALADPADLRSVLAESLPLDAARRAEWRVWVAFWGSAAVGSALRHEHSSRYDLWRAALDLVLGHAGYGRDQRADAAEILMVAVDGVGLHATLEPDRWPPGRQLARLDHALRSLPPPACR
jgi:AcrR family transcriptional regulator